MQRPLLAIDTSSAQAAIALYDGQSLSTRSWLAERSHTTTLLAEIHHLLDASSLTVTDLGAIGITIGPGAFTGLRVGFGIAKGFHLATGVPLVGVPTLQATALPFVVCEHPIVAVVAVGRGRIVWSHYAAASTNAQETSAPRNGTAHELLSEVAHATGTIVVGELDQEQEQLLATTDGALLPPRSLRVRQPAAVVELAWRRWQSNDVDDAGLLEPVYVAR